MELARDAEAVAAAERRELEARPAATAAARRALYAKIDVPCFKLRDGHTIPAVGLGTWKAGPGEVRTAVHISLQAGYRHIDCASVYQNEEEVGDALDHVLHNGLVPRSELFICSKVWNSDHAAPRVRQACLKSIQASEWVWGGCRRCSLQPLFRPLRCHAWLLPACCRRCAASTWTCTSSTGP